MTLVPDTLTPRWTPLRFHPEQDRLYKSKIRFKTVPAGRRSGKTELGKRTLVRAAMAGTAFDNARFFAGAPTYGQAKRIYWNDLKALTPKWAMMGRPSESELVIRYINGSELHVVGLDKPERIEGSPWDGGNITEMGNTKEGMWGANIRPALADRGGWCTLEGVPEGRNHYYRLDLAARADRVQTDHPQEWDSFTWISADILPAAEIAAAKRNLDTLTYQQEYEASFINFEGQCYYAFDPAVHASKPLKYDHRQPLIFMFDFNVAPGTASVAQEMVLPGAYHKDANGLFDLSRPITGTGVVGEVHIERNSNTPAVCAKLIKEWGRHIGDIYCYGDATGGASGTAQLEGSDWALIERAMYAHFGAHRVFMCNRKSNPTERARVNAVNTRLLNGVGEIHLMIDPVHAPKTVEDFDGVQLLKGGSGEIDKKATPELSHLSDGVGYYIVDKFPIDGPSVSTVQVVGY